MAELSIEEKYVGRSASLSEHMRAKGRRSKNVEDRRNDPKDLQPTKGGRSGMGKRKAAKRKSDAEVAAWTKEKKAYDAKHNKPKIKPRKDIISDEAWKKANMFMSKKASGGSK